MLNFWQAGGQADGVTKHSRCLGNTSPLDGKKDIEKFLLELWLWRSISPLFVEKSPFVYPSGFSQLSKYLNSKFSTRGYGSYTDMDFLKVQIADKLAAVRLRKIDLTSKIPFSTKNVIQIMLPKLREPYH